MQLQPFTAVATTAPDTSDPLQHDRLGSQARLAVLLYLANRPVGAQRHAIAEAIGLDEQTTLYLLTGLRQDKRVAHDKRFANVLWYVPHARAEIDPAKLQALLDETARGTA
jgi:hypothetical protein